TVFRGMCRLTFNPAAAVHASPAITRVIEPAAGTAKASRGSPGLEAVVVPLRHDAALAELHEHGEAAAHLATRRERSNWLRQRPDTEELDRHPLAFRYGLKDLVSLFGHHLLTTGGSIEDTREVPPRALRQQSVGELLLNDLGRVECRQRFARG